MRGGFERRANPRAQVQIVNPDVRGVQDDAPLGVDQPRHGDAERGDLSKRYARVVDRVADQLFGLARDLVVAEAPGLGLALADHPVVIVDDGGEHLGSAQIKSNSQR